MRFTANPVALSAALALLAPAAAAQFEISFEGEQYLASHPPADLVSADFDGDGAPDLMTVSTSNGRVNLWLNLGDGSFGAPVDVASIAGQPIKIAVGHLNGDGFDDFAVLSDVADRVYFYLGVGDGTFIANGSQSVAGTLGTLNLADLTGDGVDELIVGVTGGPSLQVAMNSGTGSFTVEVTVPRLEAATHVSVGDLNGDGDPDFVTSTWGPTVGSIVLGRPGFAFHAAEFMSFSFGGTHYWITLADVTGDGVLDAITAEHGGLDTDMVVWSGDGDGTFSHLWETFEGNSPLYQVVGDFNGDGAIDFTVRNNPDNIVPYANPGSGISIKQENHKSAAGVVAMVAADFNGDGNDDVATASGAGSSLNVWLSESDGESSYPNSLDISAASSQSVEMAFKHKTLAGQLYWVLGSASGTAPGLALDGVSIPLNLDSYSSLTLTSPNAWITNSLGLLDSRGEAEATLVIAPGVLPPAAAGLTLHHAFVILGATTGVVLLSSEALAVQIF